MSYILDAIKKSDQQRDLGTTPDVNTVHEPPPVEPNQRPTWLYALAIVLLLNAGALGWWLWADKTGKPTIPTAPAEKPAVAAQASPTSQAQAPPQPKKTTPQAPAVPPTSPAVAEIEMPPEPGKAYPQAAQPPPPQSPTKPPPPPALANNGQANAVGTKATPPPPPQTTAKTKPVMPAPAATTSPATPPKVAAVAKSPLPTTVAGAVSPPAPSAPPPATAATTTAAKGNEAIAKKPANGVVPVQTATEPAPVAEEPLAEEEAASPTDSNEVVAKTGESLSPIASTVAPKDKKQGKDSDPPELAKLPLINQLPAETQQTLPELHISFHSYSIKPSARLVSISGKILREGEDFDETVKLETITPQGVVMAAKDRRFRVKVNPNAR